MLTGAFTALVTPFRDGGVDYEGLEQLVDFQIENQITGILAVGTTGESPVLSWEEHNHVIERIANRTKDKCICIAGTGSNNTRETLEATKHAAAADRSTRDQTWSNQIEPGHRVPDQALFSPMAVV